MNNKIILVGSGYLGNYLIDMLLRKNLSCDIVELARTKKNRPDTIESIQADLDSDNLRLKSFNNGRIIYMAPPSIISLKDVFLKFIAMN